MNEISIKPSQQGQLDNLCGVYSVVNVVAFLYKDKPHFKRRALMNALLKAYAEWGPLEDMVTAGLDTWEMDMLLNLVMERGYFHQKYPITISKPFLKDRNLNVQEVLIRIRRYVGRSNSKTVRVVLIGTTIHWSVIHAVDAQFVYFFDSTGDQQARLSAFTFKHSNRKRVLHKESIYYIQRTKEGEL